MNPFKIGDLIECVNTSNGTLTIGKRYKVIRSNYEFVYIVGDTGNEGGYYSNRFKLANKNSGRFKSYKDFREWNEGG